ncbi:helix-turn-helix transcriptional regulator [Virgibacillus halodenitrificans]|uniref:helix-turn-helix domain-containing protein n=1 Tax=Virgibacillus halodenitrificans TaxID=1482 RepID=UPI001F447A49|nr:helix-turn-helix transcriptional regulator [Virgibacillus halodenitrificans]
MNVNKLKGKIVENGLTVGELANQIGMDRSTLYRKISNDGDSLTIKDVNLICRVLKLTKEEAMHIFFNQIVA